MDLNDLRCPGCEGVIGSRTGAAWETVWVWCAACQEMVQFDLSPAFTFRGEVSHQELLAALVDPPEPGLPDEFVIGTLGLPVRIAVEVSVHVPAGEMFGLPPTPIQCTSPVNLFPGDYVAVETKDGTIVSVWRAGRVVYMVPGRYGIEPRVGSDGLQANPLRNLR